MSVDPRDADTAKSGKVSPEEARRLSAEGLPYEAARTYLACGDAQAALSELVRIPRGHDAYRRAARVAIGLARELKHLDIRLENFLAAFISAGPQSSADMEAFYELAEHYLELEFPENAEEAFGKLIERDPRYRDAKERLSELLATRAASRRGYDVLAEDEAFWRPQSESTASHPLPPRADLPDLPDLPTEAEQKRPASRPPPSLPPESPPPVARSGSGTAMLSGGPDARSSPAADFRPAGVKSLPGTVLADRYRVEEKLGDGGMATVFRATDLELDEVLAIKVFTDGGDEDSLGRFRQELKLARQLIHPNIVRLYDLGVSNGLRYITMELLIGNVLGDELGQPMEQRRGLEYLIQAATGLQVAHENGVIHRDVKPDNFFVTQDGGVKVMDFGIAKQQAAPGITRVGTVAGTPQYMSPEQINNFTKVSPGTDLYALGVVAYQMFTGELPFDDEDLMPLLMMHLQDEPKPPREITPEISEELEHVILKLLRKDPLMRYRSCRDLVEVLRRIVASL